MRPAEIRPYKKWLAEPYKSDNGRFEFYFNFADDTSGNLNIKSVPNDEEKSFPFQITEEEVTAFITIEYPLIHDTYTEQKGIKKSLKAMLHFLIHDVFDVNYQFRTKEESLEFAKDIISQPILSKNRNIEFQFVYSDDKSGILKIIDNRIQKTTDGFFALIFSEDYNKWFIDLSADIRIKTATGEFPFTGVFLENLVEYLNKIAN